MLHIYFKMVQLPALVTMMVMPGLVSFGVAACRHGGVADQPGEDWVDHLEEQTPDPPPYLELGHGDHRNHWLFLYVILVTCCHDHWHICVWMWYCFVFFSGITLCSRLTLQEIHHCCHGQLELLLLPTLDQGSVQIARGDQSSCCSQWLEAGPTRVLCSHTDQKLAWAWSWALIGQWR